MANDKAFKVKNGLVAQRYLQSAGTETGGVGTGYNLSNAVYDSVSFSVGSEETNPNALFFKPDGTKMYVIGSGGDDVNEYDLSTAWDISTASYLQNFSVAAQDTFPTGLFFKDDGTTMYVVGQNGYTINEYTLSTAWDVSTASYVQNFDVSTQALAPTGLFFKSDGTKMYVLDSFSDAMYEYNLSTAWNISTSSYVQNFSVASQESSPFGLSFKSDGTVVYIVGPASDAVHDYDLSTAWDISTASYANTFSVASQDTNPNGLFFKPDGSKMYVLGVITDTIYQYSTVGYTQTLDISTGTYFSFTPSGDTTVSFTNPPASGLAIGFAVEINGDGSAITWPTSVKWPSGTAPTATATKEIYTFITTDGGTTYYGKQAATELV